MRLIGQEFLFDEPHRIDPRRMRIVVRIETDLSETHAGCRRANPQRIDVSSLGIDGAFEIERPPLTLNDRCKFPPL